jgi:cytochrome c oxidase assembly protein subunit 15
MGNIWLHRYAVFTATCTGLLVFAGSLVTSTDSGLSVPDWPLSYGMLMPPMVGNVRFEHGHRMVATFVGMLTVILAIWLQRRESHPLVKRLGWFALLTVVAQGLLGGLTVLLLLPTQVSVAHACLGQTFFCLVVSVALLTSPGWRRDVLQRVPVGKAVDNAVDLRTLTLWLTACVYVQLFLGAWMRHSGAGLAIPDFPLAYGGILPPFGIAGVPIHFAHRLVGFTVAGLSVWVAVRTLRAHRNIAAFAKPAGLLVTLVMLQIVLGALTIWTAKGVLPTTFHVLNGAVILATSLVLTLRVRARLLPREATTASWQTLTPEQVGS